MDSKEQMAIEKKISILEGENEALDQEVSKEQKKAALRELRQQYGKDWKRVIWGALRGIRINKENLQTLHSLGTNHVLRELNDPRNLSLSARRLFKE